MSDTERPASDTITVAIVGRPNVGKSSLMNRILGSERVLVDDVAGTTRDPVEATFEYQNRTYCLVDTAGIRSQRKLKAKIDAVARFKALEALSDADVSLGVVDGSVGVVQDDLKLLSEIVSVGKPLCLAVNKWDLRPTSADCEKVAMTVRERAPFVSWAPVICTSAKTGENVFDALTLAAQVAQEARRRVAPPQLRGLLAFIQADPKAPVGIRNARLFRLTQAGVAPPSFHLLGRVKRGLRPSDMGYLEKVFRAKLALGGTPIRIRILSLKRTDGRR